MIYSLQKNVWYLFLLSIICNSFYSCNTKDTLNYVYPEIQKSIAIDTYHGQQIEDPYRNLENLEDSTVIHWLKEQNNLANNVLQKINHGRERLINIQKQYAEKNKVRISRKAHIEDGAYLFLKQKSDEKYRKLFFRAAISSNDSLIFDPGNYKPNNNDTYRINYFKPDWNGTQVVISLSKNGAEISELILVNLKTKETIYNITSNAAPTTLLGINWLPDNSGFIYQHVPLLKANDPAYLHNTKPVLYTIKQGKNGNKERKLFSRKEYSNLPIKKEDFPIVSLTNRKDPYLFNSIAGSSPYSDTYYTKISELNNKKINWEFLFSKKEKIKKFLHKDSSIVYLTANGSSNFKICMTSITNPDFLNPEIIIEEKENEVITNFEYAGDRLFYTTLTNGVVAKLYQFKNGKEVEIQMPQVSGTIYVRPNQTNSKNLKIYTSGWTNSSKEYLYDYTNNEFIADDLSINELGQEFEKIQVKEIEIRSHDGVMVPLSIIYNVNIKLDGSHPTLIRGYGSYGTSFSPGFRTNLLTWVKEGGVLAICHVRGGGEKGNDWHEAGRKTTKPNTWKDAIACTEYLIEKGYTSKEKTVVFGSSAGGITMGRAITERPDLYRVAIGDVPSMNLLRSETGINGLNSVKEYGTVEVKEEFEALLEMDSYHQIKDAVNYPATLIASGYKDSRVPVWSPGKFVARLQDANSSDNPILFLVDFDAGHSVQNDKMKTYQKYADYFAFALWQTGHPDYQPQE